MFVPNSVVLASSPDTLRIVSATHCVTYQSSYYLHNFLPLNPHSLSNKHYIRNE
uniref:Uncharacterized protein n=1 Tax=Caenorhabditis japonica TaxID=281687 RepID=A0A8R1EI73_CAEJA